MLATGNVGAITGMHLVVLGRAGGNLGGRKNEVIFVWTNGGCGAGTVLDIAEGSSWKRRRHGETGSRGAIRSVPLKGAPGGVQ